MKKLFLCILLLSSCMTVKTDKTLKDFASGKILLAKNCILSPENVMLDDKSRPVTGIVREDTQTGIFLYSVQNGRREGITRVFSPDGRLAGEREYKNNLLEGISRTWFPNGYIMTETRYKNGKKNGVETRYMAEPFWGRKRDETTYVNDVKQGLYVRYGGSSKSFAQYYKNGVLDGSYTAFFPDGKTMRTAAYVNGLRQGKVVSYHRRGGIASEVNVVDDKEEGIERHYDYDGKLSMEVNYQYGAVVPPVIGYYPDGTKRFVINKVRDKKPRYDGYCLNRDGKRARDFDEREEKYLLTGVKLWGCGEFR